MRVGAVGADQCRGGAALECRRDEIVAVEALAAQRDEQIARLRARGCRW